MHHPFHLIGLSLLMGLFVLSLQKTVNSREEIGLSESSEEKSGPILSEADDSTTNEAATATLQELHDLGLLPDVEKLMNRMRQEVEAKYDSPGVRELTPFLERNDPEALITYLGDDYDPKMVVYEKDGTTLMHMAARYDADRVVKMLVYRGGLIDVKNKYGKWPLEKSLGMDSIHDVEPRKAAEVLIRSGADLTLSNGGGITALHLAARNGRPKLIELLISKGANVNAKQYNGDMPLHLAIRECLQAGRYGTEGRYFSAIRALLDHGARINDQGANQLASMDIAKPQQNQELIKLLAEYGGETTLELDLEQAIYSRDIDYFKKNHSEASDREMGARLLRVAAIHGEPEIITYLLTLGVPVDASTPNGITPLHLCGPTGSLEAARVLIDYGAGVNSQDEDGSTPLHFAAEMRFIANRDSDRLQTALLFIRKGAEVNVRNNLGETPLDMATESGFEEMAQLLRENGGVSGTTLEEEE